MVKDLTSQVDALTLRVSDLETGICSVFSFTVIVEIKILTNFTFSNHAAFGWGHSSLIDSEANSQLKFHN